MNRKMKNLLLIKPIALTLAFIMIIFIASCGGDDPSPPEETPQEIAQALLQNNWTIANGGSITLDGSDVSSRYDGFTLNVGNLSFTTTNAGELFPANGTWQWVGTTDNMVTTGNGKEITITQLTTTRFVFSFQKTNQNTAAGVPGSYVVTLTR